MKIALVGPDLEENLSLAYLSAAVQAAGHHCTRISFNCAQDVKPAAAKILRAAPDLVGLSLVAQIRYRDVQHLVARVRDRGYTGHITAGGHFAGLRASEVLRDCPGIDTIIHHDGERRLTALVAWISACSRRAMTTTRSRPAKTTDAVDSADPPATIDGVSWRRADGSIAHRPPRTVADLDEFPNPARRRPDRTLGLAKAPLVASRGCSGTCAFCSIHAWHRQVPGARLRLRSPERLADEMVALHRELGVRVFVFHDDDFIHPDKREALRRCRRIFDAAERGIGRRFAFVIKCRPNDVDEPLFRYLKQKGLARAYVGIEAHAASGLRALNRGVSPQTNLRALRTLEDLGVYACFNLLLFHPDTTPEELRENIDFLAGHTSHPFDVARTELYARSTLEERMIRTGRAVGDYRGFDYRIADPRAEAAFQLFADALWERHFGGHSILHRAQDLGFRHSLLARLYPQQASPDLAQRVRGLIRDVNEDTVEHLRLLVSLAASPHPPSRTSLSTLKRDIGARERLRIIRWASLSVELEARALAGRLHPQRTDGRPVPRVLAALPRLAGRVAAAVPWIGLALVSASCEQTSVCDPPPPPIRSFSDDIEPALDQGCATSACHSVDAAAAGLVLATGESYDHTVDVPSTQVPALDRIAPGRPDSSYVLHKLRGTQELVGGSGVRMPKGGTPDTELISDLESWISDGAEEN